MTSLTWREKLRIFLSEKFREYAVGLHCLVVNFDLTATILKLDVETLNYLNMFRLTSSFCRCISSEMAGGNFSTLLLSRYRAVKWFHRNNAGLKFRMPLSRTNSLMYISRPASSWLWKNKKVKEKIVKLSRFVLISKQWHFDEFLNTFNFVKKNSWKHHVCCDF